MAEIACFDTTVLTRSLYLHWPFCPYKCHFCPFVALAGLDRYMGSYHQALMNEITYFAQSYPSKQPLDTVFLGGGTPSTYPNELLLDMSGRLKDVFLFDEIKEVTIEVNPGTVRDGQLAIWKQAGINRLSIGVQGLKDAVLHSLNRHQTKGDVLWLIQKAAQEFENISIDLIVGLPGVSPDEWKQVMETIVTWPITHVSIYFLTVHEDTQLYFRVQTNKVALPLDEQVVDSYLWSIEWLAQHGFEQYEISNFARPGFQSQHNRMYWERKPFKGMGIGAWSFDGRHRLQNQKNIMKYMASIEQKQDVTLFAETLSDEQAHLEKVMLGLRRAQGIQRDELCIQNNGEHKDFFNREIAELVRQGLMKVIDDRIRLTPTGLVVHHAIVTRLSCKH